MYILRVMIKQSSKQESIQVKFPVEMAPLFDKLREIKKANFEPSSNKAIAVDAVKTLFLNTKERK